MAEYRGALHEQICCGCSSGMMLMMTVGFFMWIGAQGQENPIPDAPPPPPTSSHRNLQGLPEPG